MAQFSGEVFWLKYPANFSDAILICQPSHCQPDFPAKFSGQIIRPNLPTKIRHPNLPAKLSDQFLPEHECSGSIFGQLICWPKMVSQIFWPNVPARRDQNRGRRISLLACNESCFAVTVSPLGWVGRNRLLRHHSVLHFSCSHDAESHTPTLQIYFQN